MQPIEIKRVAVIHGRNFDVPDYVFRTKVGWQARVGRVRPSQHFADSCYGGPVEALTAAGQFVANEKRAQAAQGRG